MHYALCIMVHNAWFMIEPLGFTPSAVMQLRLVYSQSVKGLPPFAHG